MRGHRGTGGTTITNERFKARFEKLTGERFENPREEIEIAVNEMMDIRQELLAMEENDLLIEEPDEEEIECEGSSSGKDQVRMTYMKESGDEMKKEAVKMVQFMLSNRGHKWEE